MDSWCTRRCSDDDCLVGWLVGVNDVSQAAAYLRPLKCRVPLYTMAESSRISCFGR